MKKIIALFTAMAFALTLGVAFAEDMKAAAPAAAPEKKMEEKAPAKKAKKEKKAKKAKKAAKMEETKKEAAAPAAPAGK